MVEFRIRLARFVLGAATAALPAGGCAPRQSQYEPARPPEPSTPSTTSDPADPSEASERPSEPQASAAPRAEPTRPAASPSSATLALPVEGFGDAVVVAPLSDEPHPMLIAAHGAGDTPEWQCQHWGPVARGRFYVLCPRGTPFVRGDDSAYFYRDHHALEREVVAVVKAARAKFGGRLAATGGVYTGYSQGATMGALMVIDHGTDFPHLILVEGGSSEWTLGRAQRYRSTGGQSVAIVCGTPGCATRGKRSQTLLERASLRARVEHAEGGGHTYIGSVGERATRILDTWTHGK